MAMWASGLELDRAAQQAAQEKADGIKRVTLSPAALKKRLAAKKAAARAAKKASAS